MYPTIAQATVNVSPGVSGDAVAGSLIWGVLWLAVAVGMLVAGWKLFAKAGRPGWAVLIPLYNTITLLRITGRSGWWVLGFYVPLLNIFLGIRLVFELARVFGRGVGFGFGLLFVFPVFVMILGFGDATYVAPNGDRTIPAPTGGLAPAPVAA